DDDAADRCAVTTDIFRGRMHDNRGAMLDRFAKHRAGRVVHDERDTHLATDLGNFRDREDCSFGLGNVSPYQQRVRASLALRKFSGSAGSTKRHSMPMLPMVFWKRFQVPP